MTIEQAINKVIQIIDSETNGKESYWAVPIVHELKKLNCSLLIQWGGRCIQIYLSEFGSNKRHELEKYLKEALNPENNYTPEECVDIGRKIWY